MSNLVSNTTLSGEYKIVIKNSSDIVVQETEWFDNLILNQGLDRLGTSSAAINYAQAGTGSTPPANTQTSLVAILGGSSQVTTADSVVNSGTPLYQTSYLFRFVFSQGSIVGDISEVGVGWGATGATLFSRALILDINDNPISVTITAADQLVIYYRITVIPRLTDTTGTLTVGNVSHPYTKRVAQVASFGVQTGLFNGTFSSTQNAFVYTTGATLGSITGLPQGSSSVDIGTASPAAYTNGTYFRDATWTAKSNVTTSIKAVLFRWTSVASFYSYQLLFDTAIPKLETNTFTITMRFSWSR